MNDSVHISGGSFAPKSARMETRVSRRPGGVPAGDLIGISNSAVTLAFHLRFGAKATHDTAQDAFFVYPRERFEADRAGFFEILRGENET